MVKNIDTGAKLEAPDDIYKRLNTSITDAEILPAAQIPEDVMGTEDYLGKAESALGVLEESNKDFIAGKLPKAVASEIKRRNAELVALQGFGVGPATGRKTLRDLGQSSLSMVQQGQQTQAVVAEGYRGLAGVKESMREFNSSFSQQSQQLLDASKRTNLAATAAGLEYSQFRAELTNTINQQVVGLTGLREELLFKYTASEQRSNFADTAATIDNVLDQLNQILGA